MKKYVWVFALCLLPMGFLSCGDGDEDMTELDGSGNGTTDGENGSGSNGGTSGVESDGTQPPLLADVGIRFPVTSVDNGYLTHSFHYSNGRLSAISVSNTSWVYTISTNPLAISIEDSYNNRVIIENIKVNQDGFITSAQYKNNEKDGGYEVNGTVRFEYDATGHCIKEITKEKNIYNDDFWGVGVEYDTLVVNHIWQDDNLVNSYMTYSLEDTVFNAQNEYDNHYYERYESDYRYFYNGDKNPNTGIHFAGNYKGGKSNLYGWGNEERFVYNYYSGLLGRLSRNIPVRVDQTSYYESSRGSNNSTTPYSINLQTDYNENGSIHAITQILPNGYTYKTTFGYDNIPLRNVKQESSFRGKENVEQRAPFGSLRGRMMQRRMAR